MCYHGAFATGKSLHEEKWVDLGGGAKRASCFTVASCGGPSASANDVESGATHSSYAVTASATDVVNGRYYRISHLNGAPCLENGHGTQLFRVRLHVNPEFAKLFSVARVEQKARKVVNQRTVFIAKTAHSLTE